VTRMSKSTKPRLRPGEIHVSAEAIVRLLAARHADGVFVPECKDGPTQRHGHRRMDAWAMSKSWSNPLVVAYEVKVSRSDFVQDDKWRGYLALCNQFYFVSPLGVILESELPDEVGLICVSSTGTKLYTKKKAAYRQVVIPEELYRYILMCRTIIVDSTYSRCPPSADQTRYWKDWLAKRDEDRELGRNVGKAMRKLVRDRIGKVETENERLTELMKEFSEIHDLCTAMGFEPGMYRIAWEVRNKLREASDPVGESLKRSLRRVRDEISALLDKIDPKENEPN